MITGALPSCILWELTCINFHVQWQLPAREATVPDFLPTSAWRKSSAPLVGSKPQPLLGFCCWFSVLFCWLLRLLPQPYHSFQKYHHKELGALQLQLSGWSRLNLHYSYRFLIFISWSLQESATPNLKESSPWSLARTLPSFLSDYLRLEFASWELLAKTEQRSRNPKSTEMGVFKAGIELCD